MTNHISCYVERRRLGGYRGVIRCGDLARECLSAEWAVGETMENDFILLMHMAIIGIS